MQRTLRILRAGFALLSLLLCIASLVFWMRSHRISDSFTLGPFPGKWSISTNHGRLSLTRERTWLEPADVKSGIKPLTYERSFAGFGSKQSQDSRTWQGQSRRTIPYETILKSYFVPLWFCFGLFLILPFIDSLRLSRYIHRRGRGLCLRCGYDMRASGGKCPECGALGD